MTKTSTRFSHRHLLAIGTFLVPLMVLAVLGWNELQRSGNMAVASLGREAQQFLKRAQEAIAHRIDLQVGEAMSASRELLSDDTPTRTAIRLREEIGIESALDVLLLNDTASLVWPSLPNYNIHFPLVAEPTNASGGRHRALAMSDVLIKHHKYEPAKKHLSKLIAGLLKANPPNEDGSRRLLSGLLKAEAHARLDLGSILRKQENFVGARKQYQEVSSITRRWPDLRLMANSAIAELDSPEDRLTLLRRLAEDEYDDATDGLAGAVADRLAATFEVGDTRLELAERYLSEIQQLAETRAFAGKYALGLKYRFLVRLWPEDGTEADGSEQRFVHRLEGEPALLVIRSATVPELDNLECSYVAVHFDLDTLIAPALASIAAVDLAAANYALSITDPTGALMRTPKNPAPSSYVAPLVYTNELALRVYPANPKQVKADAQSAATKRTLLVLVLFMTALGGALWSWRSVSREAELANLKINLVSRVSHELKTPLSLIRMYGETIGMGRVRDQAQAAEFGSIIARESERLTTLIQRILDFSRQQSGTLTYQTEPYDIGELLRTTAYAYAPHLEAKGVLLIDSLPLGLIVSCDKDGLEGAIVNLLENATKYGFEDVDEHEVDLMLQKQGDYAVLEVQDRGRGIPARERNRIFEGFYRASNSGEVRGAGLGLGIVQHFARAHDGDIEALPREGGGTIMRLTLPLAQRNNAPTSQAPNRTTGTPT